MNEKTAWIPRNLAEEDFIKFAGGIKIRPSDLPIIGTACMAVSPFTGELEDMVKYSVHFITAIVTYYISRIQYKGQDLPELLMNSIVYGCRKHNYNRKRGKI